MNPFTGAFSEALKLVVGLDKEFLDIVGVSLFVSFISTCLASVAGVSFGIFVARRQFRGRQAVVAVINTLMSFPTVVVGLLVYSFLSRQGPLGGLDLLFTPWAMIIGQCILAFPIIAGLTFTSIRGLDKRIHATALSLGADHRQSSRMFFHEARFSIMAAVMAGFGRVFAEIGVSMMLGGNIKGYTRNITTAIALETSKGEFAIAIALGMVLLTVAFMVNGLFAYFQRKAK
jgi:tungstate transport system permease protein